MKNVVIENVAFSQQLYEKNVLENYFSDRESINGIGDEENANN